MRTIFFLLLFPASQLSFAQKDPVSVLQAERSFAAYAIQHGTKSAFLYFADSNGVVFEGPKAVNAIEKWSKITPGPGILNWYPVYGFLSASGDLGFTTGPWTFQPKSTTDSIAA